MLYFNNDEDKKKFFKDYNNQAEDIANKLKKNIAKGLDIFNIRFVISHDIRYRIDSSPAIEITAECHKKGELHYYKRVYDFYLIERMMTDKDRFFKEERKHAVFNFAEFLLENL